ncbi:MULTISPECIES: beta-ketoacyl-ACP synthase [Brucella]|uniref:3-oxoacyl-[acyl-carrier-protein] synthase 1 n=13 Tax=Brucella TaxID=234 RepID=A0AAI8E812_BRUSS|nr:MULTISPECIES: beta-ketoacyl-ACP synthase [Brucella]EXU83094.1 3-oxoacyl-ACP synthase [Brucella melitensis 548]AAL52293.1 3-oxoacyl-(acyl-carrier-protein) synthase ii [Brucella melitensis bv. 1 str. 16M]AAN29783.1 beta-ketoacyl synthase family protein [Brucella suis 1330]ABY37959.1 beta-ketoacyl synthase family protein [Brucella suis ATCC 23445]ACO00645.1 Oxytetracycline polyketide beta-ketoacyl synthase 1 [Brucella melitensis ATCC 23457]
MQNNKVVITGIGLISSLGEGVEAHWNAFSKAGTQPHLEKQAFAPYTVHPLGEVDWSLQIPKRGDQRQMETWQRLGTYAAGLALQDAGMKGDEALCATMDMIVGAGGGERDITVDMQILEEGRTSNNRGVMLNEKLSTELRPTLFLAQLSNLLAGNISIVHKVTGSSRTFMGEEGSGISAIETAAARIRTGQSTHALVGGSYNAEHFDMILGAELGGLLKHDGWAALWSRDGSAGGGMISGSGGVFLVLESVDHAQKRGARAYAEISGIESAQIRRSTADLEKTVRELVLAANGGKNPAYVVSGASGAHAATAAEKAALESVSAAYRGISGLTGHLREAQFPLALALGAISVWKGEAFAPLDASEKPASGAVSEAIVTTIGATRAEGAAKLVRA